MNQDSFYRLLSTMSITLLPSHLICTYIFLRPLMHNPTVYFLSKVLCRFPLLHAQFSSTWVIINMETLLPPSKPLFSWLHPLSYVSFLCHFKMTSVKRVSYAASKFFSPILSWIHSSQVYNLITLLNLLIKVTDDHHALKFNSQFSIPILVNLSIIFLSFTSESK